MDWADFFGYLSAILVFATFYMKTMIPLRLVAIASNVSFITYGLMGGLHPIYILHMLLLPLNVYRLFQMRRLIRDVREASRGDLSIDWLIPYMTKERHKAGDVLFSAEDEADKLYFVQEGTLRLEELGKNAEKGELVGEIGVFSPYEKRTVTVICETDAALCAIGNDKVIQLYHQNPEFGFALVQLISKRLIENWSAARLPP